MAEDDLPYVDWILATPIAARISDIGISSNSSVLSVGAIHQLVVHALPAPSTTKTKSFGPGPQGSRKSNNYYYAFGHQYAAIWPKLDPFHVKDFTFSK